MERGDGRCGRTEEVSSAHWIRVLPQHRYPSLRPTPFRFHSRQDGELPVILTKITYRQMLITGL